MSDDRLETIWASTVFAPVSVRNPFEVTRERLVRGIRLGMLADGYRLPPERELADTLGVSRMTLREAIKALRAANLVESRRGRGGGNFVIAPVRARVRSLAKIAQSIAHGVDDALSLQRVVEPGAAVLAATHTLTAGDRASLRRYLDAATNTTPEERRQSDSRLHLAIAAIGGSASVTAAVADVQMRLHELLEAIPVTPADIAHSDLQHARIVEEILSGHAGLARVAMEEHIDATAALLRGYLS